MTKRQINITAILLLCATHLGAVSYVDPTRPPDFIDQTANSTHSPNAFQLTAIFTYPSYTIAIINGQVFKLGDHLGEYTITRIDTNTVELESSEHNNQLLTLLTSVRK